MLAAKIGSMTCPLSQSAATVARWPLAEAHDRAAFSIPPCSMPAMQLAIFNGFEHLLGKTLACCR